MIKKLSFLFFSLFLTTTTFAQHLEAGILVGGANYLGDLSSNSSRVYFDETRFAGGAFVRYNFSDYIAARIGFNYANISGHDSNANDAFIRSRNLSFQSSLLELGVMAEFNILGYQPYALYRVFSPYIFAGVTGAKFNPKTDFMGQTVDLRPLGTEGQNLPNVGGSNPYGDFLISIPFGFGLKYAITDKINIGLELGARRTFTDFLDDVSGNYVAADEFGDNILAAELSNRSGQEVVTGTPRGDDTTADWYFIGGMTLSYNFLDNGLMGGRKSRRSRRGCKSSSF